MKDILNFTSILQDILLETFVSVWCFFAAIASLVIYKIIQDQSAKEMEREKGLEKVRIK